MKKILLSAGLVWASLSAQAQCEAVASINEDFADFTIATSGAFPQNCWSAIAGGQMGPLVYTAQAGTPANQYATIYSLFGINTAAYLITPQLSSIDGSHELSFSTWKLAQGGDVPAGNVTLQVGTLTDPADATTFVAFGDAITVTDDATTHSNIVIPATANGYIAFKFNADANHNAIAIDDVTWTATVAPEPTCEAVTNLDEDFSDFTIATSGVFPQNCWNTIAGTFQAGPVIYTAQAGDPANQYATFYASTAINTASYLITPELSNIDGNHQLSFSSWKLAGQGGVPAGTVSIQVGTITDVADAETFVPFGDVIAVTSGTAETFDEIVIPATETNKHIAFKITADTAHNAIAIDDVTWTEVPVTSPVCEVVTEIDEDFTNFADEDFPFNCWEKIENGTMLYTNTAAGNTTAAFYSSFSANTAAYLIAPEVSNIDGAHTLTFDAKGSAAATIALQPGYLTGTTDASTFVAVGDVISLSATELGYSLTYPAITGSAHIAFQFTAPGQHQTAALDNVKWQTAAGVGTNNKSVFAVFPNPSQDRNITIANNTQQDGNVAIFSLTGAKVFEAKVSGAAQQLNLSSLSAGMYVVRFTSGNAVATQKLIIQ